MGCLLMTRASIDVHQRKQVLDFEMAICQNKAEATKAIREAKAHCGAATREAETCHATTVREAEAHCATTVREAEAHCATTIREAEAHSSTTIMEAEACCAADIREAESHCVDHACAIQQSHSDNMQHLEREAIEEEGKDCQSFLATCGMVLQVCPPEAHGVLMCPFQLLMGNTSGYCPGHPPSGIYCQGGTYPCNLPSGYSCGTCALLKNKTVALFAQLGSMLALACR